ncbi:MAG: hypothetical protein GY930_19295, partial [bacterium]|nr:hypothetical protein [bacterium]
MRRFPAVVESAAGFFEELLKDLEKDPAGTLGELNKTLLYPLFTTSWAVTHVAPKNTTTAVAFTLQLSVDSNTTEAIIAAGAQINQNETFRTDDQVVIVNAQTKMELVNMAGVFGFGLNAGAVFGGIKDLFLKDTLANEKKRASSLAEVGAEAEKVALGASFQWVDIINKTVAAIGG